MRRQGGYQQRRRLASLLGLSAAGVVVLGLSMPAQAAPGTSAAMHQHQLSLKGNAATKSDGGSGGGDDTMNQANQYGAERSAPGAMVSGAALAAAEAQAANLPSTGGSWNQLTHQTANVEPAGYNDPIWSNLGAGFHPLIGGRTTALAVTGSTLYAGTADGGVWKSTDKGHSWKAIFDAMPSLSIGAVAINPADHSLWVGTGEANSSSDSYAGQGVFRSTNGGSTFQLVGGSQLSSHTVFRLAFDGFGNVYAATNQGLLKRAANDTTSAWTLVLKPDPNPTNNPYQTSFITDVVVRPGTNGAVVLAADGWRGAGNPPADTAFNGFYLSTTGGGPGTFSRFTPSGAIVATDIGRTTFGYASDGSKVYAIIQSPSALLAGSSTVLQGVFLSANGDPLGPWTLIADSNKLCASGSGLTCPSTYQPGVQAWYNQSIVVDPANPNHVVFGLEEQYQTFNAGSTITTISPYWNFVFPCEVKGTCPLTTHPDQHAVAVSGNALYIGNDGGVYSREFNNTAQRGGWTDLNATLHALQYYDAEAGTSGTGVGTWGGLQDNGTMVLAPGHNNLAPAGGDGGYVIVDPTNAQNAVGEYVYLNTYLTTDGGHNFRTITPSCLNAVGPRIPGCDPSPRFIAPLATDVNDPTHWVIGGRYVWDNTKSWATVCDVASAHCDWNNVHNTGHSITAIAVNGSTIYAGWCGPCNAGGATPFASGIDTNAGGTWHTISASNLPNRFVAGLTVDSANANHVFAVYNGYSRRWIPSAGTGHVFESTDGGGTFTDISVLLPDVPSDGLVYSNGDIALATDIGAFFAEDGGGTNTAWSRLGTNLPNTSVNNIRLNPDGSTLLSATHGRGLWTLQLP